MKRSKLALYEEILYALTNKQLTVDAVAYSCNMDCVALRRRLEFLMQNDLVEEKTFRKITFYTLTGRGVAVSKTLALTKRLEKLQTTVKQIDKALQARLSLPLHSAQKNRLKRNKKD